MNGAQMLPAALGGAAAAFVAFGVYEAVKPYAWDRINLTGPSGYIAQAVNMLPGTANTTADLTNFAEKSLGLATIGGLAFLASLKQKGLGLIDAKLAQGAVSLASVIYAVNFLSEMQTYNLGNVFSNLAKGKIGNARNAFGSNLTGTKSLGMAPQNLLTNNMGMHHAVGGAHNMAGAHNYSMGAAMNNKFFGAHNQMQTANTAAMQRGTGRSAFFGTKGLGASRVNLF